MASTIGACEEGGQVGFFKDYHLEPSAVDHQELTW